MLSDLKVSRAIVISLALIFNISVQAQDEDGRFLFRDSKVKLSSFYAEIAPSTSFASLNDQSVNVSEMSLGFILNDKWYFSYFGTGSSRINKVAVPVYGSEEYYDWLEAGVELENISENAEFVYVTFRHTGLRFGYMHHTERTLFWRTGLMFGFTGGVQMTEDKTFLGLFDNLIYQHSIMSLEPHIGGGVNLLPWWRLNLDLGYRFLFIDERILDATKTDSFTIKLGFAFGNFKHKGK